MQTCWGLHVNRDTGIACVLWQSAGLQQLHMCACPVEPGTEVLKPGPSTPHSGQSLGQKW